MKAIQFADYSGIDGLALVDAPKPIPAADEVLVKIHAAGVNPVDLAVSAGFLKDFMPLTLPATAGGEFSGVIEAVGADVRDFAPSDAVHAPTGISGSFAEYITIKASGVVRKPDALSFAQAAGLPVAAATATVALDAGDVGPGTKILIHAASGGVGSVAVQMAKARGAEVTALASPANLDFVRSLGADHVVDRTTRYEDVIRDMDVVLDAFGPEAQARSWTTLRKGGILVSLVTPPSEEDAARHGVRAVRIFGSPTAKVLTEVDRLVDQGKLSVTINKTYPLAQAVEALRDVATGRVRGKNVLIVQGD